MLGKDVLTAFRLMLENGMIIQLIKSMTDGSIGINKKYYNSKEIDNLLLRHQTGIINFIDSQLNSEILDFIDPLTLASLAEVATGTIDNKGVSPEGIQSKKATYNKVGIAEYATDFEIGNKNLYVDKWITPSGVKNRKGTSEISGIVKFCSASDITQNVITADDVLISPKLIHELINKRISELDPDDYDI